MNSPVTPTLKTSGRKPNFTYTIISVSLVLLLVGIFGLWMLQAFHLDKSLKENVDILVELREGTSEENRKSLSTRLGALPYVVGGSVEFRDKENALAEMGDEITQDLRELDLPNPFRDMLSFNVAADYLQKDSLEWITIRLREEAAVLDVYYQDNFVDGIMEKARRLGWVFLVVGVILVLIAMVLIHNTVRLSLYANRFLIKSQQLVGATWGFISRPYLRRAAGYGLLCGLLAAGTLFGLQYALHQQMPELELFARPRWLAGLYGGMILLGVLINWLSHFFTVRRYLKMRVDDLY
ncbi:hypothetical protein CEQ90_10030 [Lewinellaceae bacterium SD302]|nr:hypothetical protein CEQ90_10030 [Lewinellaceae bacterium SD302]